MRKTPKYEIDEILTKIMGQFCQHGYSATSIRDLKDAMGLFRGSLYHAFGDKREMFFRALRHYDRLHRADPIAEFERDDSPRGAVLAVFDAAASVALEGGSREGCLEVNAALELGAHDEEVASLVADAFASMAKFFCVSLPLSAARLVERFPPKSIRSIRRSPCSFCFSASGCWRAFLPMRVFWNPSWGRLRLFCPRLPRFR